MSRSLVRHYIHVITHQTLTQIRPSCWVGGASEQRPPSSPRRGQEHCEAAGGGEPCRDAPRLPSPHTPLNQ
ncbi:hypothetical protein E2C01_097729 [Portunus trituberculatus]|uniref:Uncharacterized protein n=1 Tax=Portunus trituberculatus TaxID=210409 RepID=A0A5B7KAS8_PORTR|nr:hypothetical protein [Portunus trituberculatus]